LVVLQAEWREPSGFVDERNGASHPVLLMRGNFCHQATIAVSLKRAFFPQTNVISLIKRP
jgi:hypothetical protein